MNTNDYTKLTDFTLKLMLNGANSAIDDLVKGMERVRENQTALNTLARELSRHREFKAMVVSELNSREDARRYAMNEFDPDY